MRLLIEIAMKTKGEVRDCPEVLEKTEEYRKDKDIFNEFDSENIIRQDDSNITKTNLRESFTTWYEDKYDRKNMPTGKELYQWFDAKYGKCKIGVGWKNIAFITSMSLN